MTVLLVDDDGLVRRCLEALLTEAGYEVVSAATASEAVGFASSIAELDVLVTDIVLDRGTGFDVQVFVLQRHPRAGTLFMTGYAIPDTYPHIGRTAWLQKPFDREELLRSVGALVASPQQRCSTA